MKYLLKILLAVYWVATEVVIREVVSGEDDWRLAIAIVVGFLILILFLVWPTRLLYILFAIGLGMLLWWLGDAINVKPVPSVGLVLTYIAQFWGQKIIYRRIYLAQLLEEQS